MSDVVLKVMETEPVEARAWIFKFSCVLFTVYLFVSDDLVENILPMLLFSAIFM